MRNCSYRVLPRWGVVEKGRFLFHDSPSWKNPNLRIYKNNIGELGAQALAAYHVSKGASPWSRRRASAIRPIIYPDYDKWYGLWAAGNAGRGIA